MREEREEGGREKEGKSNIAREEVRRKERKKERFKTGVTERARENDSRGRSTTKKE